MIHVRFAPSPTGRLHPGNARTALINALFARRHGGRFTLRVDDTDPSREEPGAVEAIRSDLAWLGIAPDGEQRQSARVDRHREIAAALAARGEAYAEAGAVRLRLGGGAMAWDDAVHGSMRVSLAHQRDPVLVRADGRATYTLASVVDDIDGAVSHVIRGDDHLTNTAVHLRLIAALGHEAPVFAHLPLVVDRTGTPLSKRSEAVSLAALRAAGVEPEPLVAYLASLGTGRTVHTDEDPAAALELGALSSASPIFDLEALVRTQEHWLQSLPVEAVNARLVPRGESPVRAAMWTAFRANLADAGSEPLTRLPRLERLSAWRAVVEAPLVPAIDAADADTLAQAADLLEDGADPQSWLDAVAAATGRRGRRLRLPIRRALTGRSDGPPLGDLIALIGAERVRRRLRGERA